MGKPGISRGHRSEPRVEMLWARRWSVIFVSGEL